MGFTMNTIIYNRVSTGRQDVSLALQLEKCELQAKLLGSNVVKVIVDEAETGSNFNRSGIDEMKALIEDKSLNIQNIIVYNLSRLSRNLLDISNFLEYLKNSKSKGGKEIALISTQEAINTQTIQGTLMLQMLTAFSEFEVSTIRSRTSEAIQKIKRSGKRYTNIVPFGKSLVEGNFIDNPKEVEAIDIIMSKRAAGVTYPDIAKELQSLGYETRKGGEWRFYSVRAIYLRVLEEQKQAA
jgi:site-specific DNA recombinase